MTTTFETKAREHIASRGSKDTRAVYNGDLAKWLTFCEFEAVNPDSPPFTAVAKFRDQMVDKYAKPTARRILSAISSMYDYAGLANPFKSSKRLQRPEPDEIGVTQEFTPEEVDALFRAAGEDRRVITIMQLLFDTGLRISEVLSIRRDQLFQHDLTRLRLVCTVKKKGRVETLLPVTSKNAVETWLLHAPLSKFLFPGRDPRKPITASWFRAELEEIGKRAGVRDVHPHRFRATFATQALDAGIPLHDVQAAMHHSDPKTTLRYDRGKRGTGVTEALANFRKGEK